MTRVKRGYVARKRRRFIFTLTSRFRGAHSKLFRTANQQGRFGRKRTTNVGNFERLSQFGTWKIRIFYER